MESPEKIELKNLPILNIDNYNYNYGRGDFCCISNKDDFNKSTKDLVELYNKVVDKLSVVSQKIITNQESKDQEKYKKLCERIENILKIINKPYIQIGLLGTSNAGKSSLINAIFDTKLCEVGTTTGTTSSCIVSYFNDKKKTNKHDIVFMDNEQLGKKFNLVLEETYKALYPNDHFPETSAFEKQSNSLYQKIIDNRDDNSDSKIKSFIDFLKLVKTNKIKLGSILNLDNNQDFRFYVNHLVNIGNSPDGKSQFGLPDRHAVLHARAPGLPNYVPSVIEIVDVPGVGNEKNDNLVVEFYYKNIDAWLFVDMIESSPSIPFEQYSESILNDWKIENNIQIKPIDRCASVLTKVFKLSPNYHGIYSTKIKVLVEKFNECLFLTDRNAYDDFKAKKFEFNESTEFTEIVNNDPRIQFFQTSDDAVKNNHLASIKEFNLQDKIKKISINGGIPHLKNFLFKDWPQKIINQIIFSVNHKLYELLSDSITFLKQLDLRKLMSPHQSDQIQKGLVALNDEKNKLLTSKNSGTLKDVLMVFVEDNELKIDEKFLPNSQSREDIRQATTFIKNEAVNNAARLLSLIIGPKGKGLLDKCYDSISEGLREFTVRFDTNSADEKKLAEIFKEKKPLNKEEVENLTNQAQVFSSPDKKSFPKVGHDALYKCLNEKFKTILNSQTGLDEFLNKLKTSKSEDLMDWIDDVLFTHGTNEEFQKFKKLIERSYKILVIDCATIIRNHLIQDINDIISKLQDVQGH